jgi:hypothetical protein
MGTNYYQSCPTCKTRRAHIGKNSMGHPFTANYTKEWVRENCTHVVNEYGELFTVEEFLERFPGEWDVSMTDNGWC